MLRSLFFRTLFRIDPKKGGRRDGGRRQRLGDRMDDLAPDHVRAFISRARVGEMKSRGWRVLGPGEEGSLLMEGPLVAGPSLAGPSLAGPSLAVSLAARRGTAPDAAIGDLFADLVARALERADAADRIAARRAA
ncbi:hypothetical protein ABMY26_19590 [Azospirillum sp. HJ39]|uniref:hypothetical protein n=1 Tax=Azospirillum sp. HJ39 TaxID=3159496 RepID=UPI003558A36E